MVLLRRLQALIGLSLLFAGSTALALEEGDKIPDFDIASIYADKPNIKLSDLEGKTLYIDFWASWCAPCVLSLPLYNEMYHKYKDQGLEIIAINVDNPIEDGLDFLLDTPLDFLIPQDPEGDAAEMFGVIGMPSSYLIAPDGTVRMVHMGFRNGDMEIIEEEVVKVLGGD
ncbi:MAG: TlpA disulfide reductase family protein [Gammaproteobacteria bacterium]|nr:TlpA disulfide reductase family protein [Gammaproteobacteria bacterium]MDD9897109.1 TlpA disulfide reductase family protein [Gammaproteobacteria bacterium]MDD9959134.1 TlpA disulfide reductase family protein [Gammaproteobacteria bacterium]